jgi:hypothetical protein
VSEEKQVNTLPPELADMMTRKEDLHPDLVPYIENSSFGKCLKHPLLIGLFYHDGMNAMYNAQYKAKLEYIERAKKEKNWSSFIWIHERPYRLEKFAEIESELSDQEYWELLGSIWSDSENLWQYGAVLGWFINKNRPGREAMMDEHEKKFLAKLPDEFTIYRGHQTINRSGYSWTLSYWRAKWFAKRFNQKGQGVVKAKIKKEHVVAVLLGRNEFEIVASPKNLKIETVRKTMKRPEWLETLKEEFQNIFSAGLGRQGFYSVHGPWHWEKVEKNALILAKKTPRADRLVAQIFALIHDTKRVNDDEDPEHGHRSAQYAKELFDQGRLKITESQLAVLMEACKYHNDGQVSDDPTIGVCWDADRLDLPRVGIIPNPELLSTEAAKELLWSI